VTVESFQNVYPLRYWLRLAPLPMKQGILALADATKIGNLSVPANVGNILTTAWKPAG
jgi:hypothetical protein